VKILPTPGRTRNAHAQHTQAQTHNKPNQGSDAQQSSLTGIGAAHHIFLARRVGRARRRHTRSSLLALLLQVSSLLGNIHMATVCSQSFSGANCTASALPAACLTYNHPPTAMLISIAPKHFSCACLDAVLGSPAVLRAALIRSAKHTHCNSSQQGVDTRTMACSFDRCSGNGLCTSTRFPRRPFTHTVEPCESSAASCTCACFPPWTGPQCSRRIAFHCLRNCGGHGRCLTDVGACACDPGFEGIDCTARASADVAQPGPGDHERTPPAPRIFVYDRPLPEDFFVWQTRDIQGVASARTATHWPSYPDQIYQAADAFFHRLLRDETHRTHDAESADLFRCRLNGCSSKTPTTSACRT
jgi:hypothetical protein